MMATSRKFLKRISMELQLTTWHRTRTHGCRAPQGLSSDSQHGLVGAGGRRRHLSLTGARCWAAADPSFVFLWWTRTGLQSERERQGSFSPCEKCQGLTYARPGGVVVGRPPQRGHSSPAHTPTRARCGGRLQPQPRRGTEKVNQAGTISVSRSSLGGAARSDSAGQRPARTENDSPVVQTPTQCLPPCAPAVPTLPDPSQLRLARHAHHRRPHRRERRLGRPPRGPPPRPQP